ncbi:hypothetical protein F3Y22_tig00111834pilonHSYRG00221 [Hibiscus syriacus]|uniref:Uncharacterized protein n=1 Tax=Hibiscus syriacus TaxID=106335 RepID=A0A6A2YEM3_HIBSY|nr:hypothetical protein F3Y22_tig00111834pilonHSYRG00221 [Hibiscus syriacus]
MGVRITSKEMVKPSSPELYHRKPFSLSFLDQLSPAHYVPYILFHNKPDDSRFGYTAEIMATLKESLTEALNQFYPLCGRSPDNLYIGSYDKGMPYCPDGELRNPDTLDAASRLFPPSESVPLDLLSLTETLWFQEGWHTTKTFSFHDDAIATLKLKAESKLLDHGKELQ